jgi:hypothetical protein
LRNFFVNRSVAGDWPDPHVADLEGALTNPRPTPPAIIEAGQLSSDAA